MHVYSQKALNPQGDDNQKTLAPPSLPTHHPHKTENPPSSRSILLQHLPPRLQHHLLPPPLQPLRPRRLIARPRHPLLLLAPHSLLALIIDPVLQPIPRDQIRLSRVHDRSLRRRRRLRRERRLETRWRRIKASSTEDAL